MLKVPIDGDCSGEDKACEVDTERLPWNEDAGWLVVRLPDKFDNVGDKVPDT